MKKQRSAKRTGSAQVSIEDVARLSGTSPATVSRVLSNSTYPVADKTRQRVHAAAASIGYEPNAIARALATQRARTIGLIVGDIADPYFAEIAKGVEEGARPNEYMTIICNSNRDVDAEIAYFRILLDHKVSGIFFANGTVCSDGETPALQKLVARARQEGRVVFALAPRLLEGVTMLSVDNRAVGRDLTRYMIHLGHRRIAFVGGPSNLLTSYQREAGFVDAMTEAGLDASMIYSTGFGLDAGQDAAAMILSCELPDGIIAASDDCAIGLLVALRSAGIEIPERVSIASVDDARLASMLDLTSVRVPKHELGVFAVQQFIKSLEGEAVPSQVLSHQIVMRGSTTFRRGN